MKKITKTAILFFLLLGMDRAHSQTTVYADTVLTFSSEYSSSNATCTQSWSACRILGSPDVYPLCADNGGAWTVSNADNNSSVRPREWIEVGYSNQMYVDTVRIYQTNHSGVVDTVYLRNSQTGLWITIYDTTSVPTATCAILDIVIPTTSYKVDAVRLAIGDYTGLNYPEYDAIALIGTPVSPTGIMNYKSNSVSIFPNPSSGNFTLTFAEQHNPYAIHIYDMTGRLCFSQDHITGASVQLQVALEAGIYSLEVSDENTKCYNRISIK